MKDHDSWVKTCERDDASPAEDTALQAWNAAFTEAIHAESRGLVGRPTALKGTDGQWQGVPSTLAGRKMIATGESKVASMCILWTYRKTKRFIVPRWSSWYHDDLVEEFESQLEDEKSERVAAEGKLGSGNTK